MHSPTAAPRMPASARGVSTQRFSPKRSRRPAVARKTPPARPTSSPITSTESSRASSTVSASLIASRSVSSAIAADPLELGLRGRLGLGLGDAAAHQVGRLRPHRLGPLVGEQAEAPQVALVAADALP